MNRRYQTTLEYIIIIAFVAIAGIVASMLYLHNSTSTKIGNQNAVLNAEYFVSNNGQPICNPSNPVVEAFPYIGTSCFVFVTEKPLQIPLVNYTVSQLSSTNFNIENNDKYAVQMRSQQKIFYGGNGFFFSGFWSGYDNAGFAYLGQVNGYYEYMMYTYGFAPTFNSFNIEHISIKEYSPNVTSAYNGQPPINDTAILPVRDDLLVNVVYTNQTVGPISTAGQFENVSFPSSNATITVTGLPAGAQTTLTYQYYNSTSGIETTSNTITFTSNSPVSFTVNNLVKGVTFTASVPGEVVFNGNDFFVAPNSMQYSAGSQISFQYHTLSTGTLVYSLNKPLVNGAQVYFELPNTTFYYTPEPYVNLEFTVGNTINNGGKLLNAFVTNYGYNYVVVNLGNIPNNSITTIYLNFLPSGDLGGDISFSPQYSNVDGGLPTSPLPGIFSSYNDNNGNGFWSTTVVPYTTTVGNPFYNYTFTNALPNVYYTIGTNESLQTVTSFGINTTQSEGANVIYGGQAPFYGAYDSGSSGLIMFDGGVAFCNEEQELYPVVQEYECNLGNTYYYNGPITITYNDSGFYTELANPNSFASIKTTPQNVADVVLFSISQSGAGIVYYFASSPNNILDYIATYDEYIPS